MGVTSWAKNKIKQTVSNIQAERAYNKEQQLTRRNQYDKGYQEGQYKRGLAEGSGQIVPAARQTPQGSTRRTASWNPDWKAAGDVFGSGGGGGMFGYGNDRPKAPPPMRTTRISKSGHVTITEPYERKQAMIQRDPAEDFWGTPGAVGGSRKKGSKERDPYDFIL